jgi:hypothetical protein
MIALQARGGRVADPARITAQYANMMTAARQAEAAQTQGALARQTMANNQASEARAATAAITAEQKAKFEYTKGLMAEYTNRLAKIDASDKTRYSNLRQQIIRDIPTLESELPTPDEWNEKSKFLTISDAEKFLRYKYATPVASTAINDRTGQLTSITAGGPDPRAEVIGEVPFQSATSTAPRAAPTAPQAAGPVPAGEFGEARFVPEESIPLTPFQQEHLREMESNLGVSQPASFSQGANAGPMTPEKAQQVVDTAVKTGMMAQADFDQLMTLAPDQNKQPFMDMLKANNITLQPGGMGQQSQFADFRGPTPQSRTASLGDAPEVQTTMAQSQGRTPFIARREAQAPGIYNVPTQDVAATSRATRPSKQEVYDTELAKVLATRAAGPAPVTQQQKLARRTEVANAYTKAQTLIDKAYNPKEGIVALARKIKMLSPDQKEAITGFSNYVPSFRETTREADTLFGNLKGVVTSLGKDAAAASGAVGNMAVQEWKIAADMIANLDLANMTPRALDAQMDRIIEQVSNATNLAQQVYDAQYGDDVKQYPAFKLRGGPSPKTKTPVTKAPAGVSAAEWKAMTPAERKLWQ